MEAYAGKQYVGIDLHRRRTVIVRTTASGEVLETVRIVNDVERLAWVMARAGQCPEVVLEATYGWYWAVDALQAGGANVHLAHPLGVKALPQPSRPGGTAGLSTDPVAQGSVGSLLSLPVYTDNNVPQTKGAGTQDENYVLRGPDVFLYESELQMESFDATYANQASLLVRALAFSAMIPDRYSASVNVIGGTGLIAPTL
jgi:hypothetical protein